MQNREVTLTKRQLLGLGGLALGLGGAAALGLRHWRSAPQFAPYPGVAGFRQVAGGAVSSGRDVFAGIGAAPSAGSPAPQRLSGQTLCRALFGPAAPGRVPVASFSDFYCPYCRVLTGILMKLEAAGRIDVTWHELPLLGPGSVAAARAAIAADMQNAYEPFHRRLMRAQFQPTQTYLRDLAASAGLDPAQFAEDFQSAAVQRRLKRSRAVASTFGFAGTPALVVGQTVVVGAISKADLTRLIEIEAAGLGAPAICRD
ncbi:MAG: DsbA family protein [Alphaproteobacteria bacterium]|nr:DsbA family protein [Alphaproteobacteria bacterium]